MKVRGGFFRAALAGMALPCAAVLGGVSASAQESPDGEPSSVVDHTIERGKYLATAGNCTSCHTAPGGAQFAGGRPFETPFGTIYSTNITPDPETGIGDWTLEQFRRSLREGVNADGEHLYPVFPYDSYTKVTDEDIEALYRYMISLPAVEKSAKENELRFPYNQRWMMAGWKSLFLEVGPFEPNPTKSDEWNRGAYLVEALAHCSACHSPRNPFGAKKTDELMSGGVYTDEVPTGHYRDWSAPNLTSAPTGLDSWSADEIVAYLKTGKNNYTAVFGPMNEVVMNSTRHLDDEDLHAIATYFKRLPPIENDFAAPAQERKLARGQILYDLHCGTCHQPTGLGAADTGARLVDSLVVQASDPSSLINVILYGPQLPEPLPPIGEWEQMKSFNNKLRDEDIAALASYLRQAWGNKGGEVSVEQVAKQRPPLPGTEDR